MLGPASLGVGHRLEPQHARALGQHGAVALLGKREAALGREHVHGLPGAHHAIVDDALGGADDGNVGEPVADVVLADADGVGGRRAGAAGGKCRALDAELDDDMGGGRRDDEGQQGERRGGAVHVYEDIPVAQLNGLHPAGAGADYAGDAVGVLERHLDARLLDGLVGGGRGKPRVAVSVQDDLVAREVLEPRLGVEVPDLGADQDLQVPQIEAVKGGDPELRALTRCPDVGYGRADRRHDTHTRHDDAVRYAGPLHLDVVPWCARLKILASAVHALDAAAPELAMRARTRSTTEPTVLKSAASSLAL